MSDLRAEVERIAEDCELKGYRQPLDPFSEAESDQRTIYRDIGRRLRAALFAASRPGAPALRMDDGPEGQEDDR